MEIIKEITQMQKEQESIWNSITRENLTYTEWEKQMKEYFDIQNGINNLDEELTEIIKNVIDQYGSYGLEIKVKEYLGVTPDTMYRGKFKTKNDVYFFCESDKRKGLYYRNVESITLNGNQLYPV